MHTTSLATYYCVNRAALGAPENRLGNNSHRGRRRGVDNAPGDAARDLGEVFAAEVKIIKSKAILKINKTKGIAASYLFTISPDHLNRMENILYSINLAIHILAAAFCVAAPLYQLRWVKLRGKLGYPLVYPFDRVMENILSLQPKLCSAFITTLILTGFAFPLIHYGFHGQWKDASDISLIAFSAKTALAFIGLAIVAHSAFVIDPELQKTFASFSPSSQPPDELLNRFWALRAKRRHFCQFCFALALMIMVITPILRFYK